MNIVEVEGGDWLDEHRTCDRHATRVFKITGRATGDLAADLAARTAALGALLDELAEQDAPIAITGSAWSQADLFASPAVRIDTALDNALWRIPSSALADEFDGDASRFVMASGGAKLDDVMRFLEKSNASFRTCGSHKGQSIAGAVATGSHGSLLGEMGLETHIRGMLFVCGSGAKHWICDPECPVLSDAFVRTFATPTDPSIFDDTVIHMGGLGYCAAILLEGTERFGLSWKKALQPLSADWWEAIEAGDYDRAAAPIIGNTKCSFYELTFDPNKGLEEDVMQTLYWREALPEPSPDQEEAGPQEHTRDALDIITDGINAFSKEMIAKRSDKDENEEDDDEDGLLSFMRRIRLLDIPKMTFDEFAKDVTDKPCSDKPSSLHALTGDWKAREVFGVRIDTFNAALAVPVSELKRTLEIGTDVASRWRKHFVFTVRFAAKSRASMSFLRFDETAIVNIDGLTRAGIAGWISHSDEFSRDFTDALEDAGVPFSMHWGKDVPSSADKIATDFGPAAMRYKAARAALVPAKLRDKLCPPQLRAWGLD
ncbi:MAG: hypothetical protein AAF251_12885 [Pseudomonadota bacterium]